MPRGNLSTAGDPRYSLTAPSHHTLSTPSYHTLSTSQTVAGYELDNNDFHEKMELCDVCGSFLVIGDTQCRVDAHLLGKQHIGYARIRATVTELKVRHHSTQLVHPLCVCYLCSQ